MYAGDTADQMVRMSLQGIEVVANISLKAGEVATRSLAAAIYAVLTDQKKVRGKTRIENMMKENKTLSVFAINKSDLKVFSEEAKKYGVLFCVLTGKKDTTGICEIMVKEEDASKISRIIDKLEIASIDTQAIKAAIMAQKEGKKTELANVKPMTPQEKEALYKDVGFQKGDRSKQNDLPSDKSSTKLKDKFKRQSVRKELNEIKREKQTNDSKVKMKSKGKKDIRRK